MPKRRWILLLSYMITLVTCFAHAKVVPRSSTSLEASTKADDSVIGRTFGRIKRLQMFMIPLLINKLTMIMVMLGLLIVLTLKGLLIGKTILLFNIAGAFFKFGAFFAKFKSSLQHGWGSLTQAYGYAQSYPSYPIYNKYPASAYHTQQLQSYSGEAANHYAKTY